MALIKEFDCPSMVMLMSLSSPRVPTDPAGACLGISTSWLTDALQGASPWEEDDRRFFSALAVQRAAEWHSGARSQLRRTTTEGERFASGQASQWEVAQRDAQQQQGTPDRSFLADRNFLASVPEWLESTYPLIRRVSLQCKRSCVIRWPLQPSELEDIIEAAVKVDSGFVVVVFGNTPGTRERAAVRGTPADKVGWSHALACAPWADGQRRLMDPAKRQYTFKLTGLLKAEYATAVDCARLIDKAEGWPSRVRAVCTMVFSGPGEGARSGVTLAHPRPRTYRAF